MALTQDERISISKKIVQIPLQNAASDTISGQIGEQKAKAQKEDNANKKLQDDVTVLIDGYQSEYSRSDGNGRNNLTEQDMSDSANRIIRNLFFPNDPQTPTPALADGVWKYFVPYAGNKVLGKTYAEAYTPVTKEADLLLAVSNAIAVVEAFSNITRSTGQSCNAGGSCSLPMYTTQATCEAATPTPGVWTPSGTDIIANDPAMQAAGAAVIAAIQAWEDFINATYLLIVSTDINATRSAQNNASRSDITNSLSIINAWQAQTTYNTATGQTTCSGFNSYNFNLLGPVKFRSNELNTIKAEVTARTAFVNTRTFELNTNLGTVTQNLTTGDIISATGFYGQRMRIINTRLNAIGGSLTKLKGLERGQGAQQQAKNSNDNTALVYASVMICSAFRAPSTGSATIHLLNGTGFNAGDAVYISADNQDEISTTILSVSGNTIFLADKIPQKYRQNESARMYKLL